MGWGQTLYLCQPGFRYVPSSTVPRCGYSRRLMSSCTILDQGTFQDVVAKMFCLSLLAIFSKFNCFLLCCAILILSCTLEHFRLAEGISEEMANIVFNKVGRKVIKVTVKHSRLVSITLYYSQMLKHLL
jgi:hypothetical protein